VDFVVYLLVELLLPPALRTFYKLAQLVISIGLIFIRLMLGEGVQDRVSVAWAGMVRSYLTLEESNLLFLVQSLPGLPEQPMGAHNGIIVLGFRTANR